MVLPPFHLFLVPIQHTNPLRQGNPCYVMPRFEETTFLHALKTFQITQTIVVPPIMMALSKCKDTTKLKSLRRIFVGGSSATDGMQQQLYAKLSPDARIVQGYGMTETGWSAMWQDVEKDTTGSVGHSLPGCKLRYEPCGAKSKLRRSLTTHSCRLVDGDGQIITGDGVNGEIQIWTPHPMKGYLNNLAATAEAFSNDGWVRTGDVGFVDGGRWYVIDRTKDLIKVRGWQVSPVEIEASLLEHPDILDAAVIGMVAPGAAGEVPQGFVVRKEGSDLEEKDIKEFLKTRLVRYKAVEEVRFVDRIPRNATGKILRRILRDSRNNHLVAPDHVVASRYSIAIQDLEKSQQERSSHGKSETPSPLRSASERLLQYDDTESRHSTLTDTSTTSSDYYRPATPPPIHEAVDNVCQVKSEENNPIDEVQSNMKA